jgi:hypothetical protein
MANSSIANQSGPIITNVIATNVICNGGSTGAISLTILGGTPPLLYNWSNGKSTQNIISLTVGTYTVTVTDLNNCQSNLTQVITQPLDVSVSIVCFWWQWCI